MSTSTDSPRAPRPRVGRLRRRPGVALLAVGALVALGACSGGDGSAGGDDDVTLTFAWWGDASRAERYEKAIDLYEEKNPHVTIQSSYASFADYWTSRNTEAASGSLPDVFQMDVSYLSQYGGSGQIAALDDFAEDGTIDISTFPENVMPAAKVDGRLVGIPTSTGGIANFFSTGLFDDLGVAVPAGDLTWDQYDDVLSQVGAAGADHDPEVNGSTQYVQILSVFEIWLAQHGKALYTPDGALGFTEADLAEWWQRATPLFADGGFVDPKRAEQLNGADVLGAGVTASELSFYNFLVRFSEGSAGGKFAMLLPPADDTANRGLYLKPSLELSMSATTEHPEEAARFIDFIANDPEVSKEFGLSRGAPISQPALDALEPEGLDKQILDYWEQLAEVAGDTPPPPPEGAGAVEVEFTRIAQDIGFGTTSVDDGVKEFFSTAPGMLG
ncbi:ABC transporter substrate-binding protein [Isoptericola sp. NPDC057653]|uniref:ABC transporter substrate-binding protein n=1 Tax=Isoptericola sp. NPDC057653 TaxID=3346195 RepID=UPI00369EB33F